MPNSEQQHEDLLKLAENFTTGEFRLLIIDSILNLFRSDYTGRGELSERQQKLGQFLRKLSEFATEFNIAVFMTNQVQSDPGASALFASADGRKPVGGHVLAHASATRLLLRKGRGEERVAKLMDSPGMSLRLVSYLIVCYADFLFCRLSGGGGNLRDYAGRHQRCRRVSIRRPPPSSPFATMFVFSCLELMKYVRLLEDVYVIELASAVFRSIKASWAVAIRLRI